MSRTTWITLCVVSVWAGGGLASAGQEELNARRREGLTRDPRGKALLAEGFRDPNQMDSESLITVRTVDHEGRPVPYCRIVFVDRDETTTRNFYEAVTNTDGYAYCDTLGNTFSINAHLTEYDPASGSSRSQHKKIGELYSAQSDKLVVVKWDPFPSGTGTVEGQVLDQHDRPVTKFELTLRYLRGVLPDWSDSFSVYQTIQVEDPEGRFRWSRLAPLPYSVRVIPEDRAAYVWDFDMASFTIPDAPNAVVQSDIRIEAKELFCGRAFYQDGLPVYPGSFWLWFKKYSPEERLRYHTFGEGYGNRIESDGLLRAPLSQREKANFMGVSEGYVCIHDAEAREIGQIHIDKLSKQSNQARAFYFPRAGPRDSLVGATLPDLSKIDTRLDPEQTTNKSVLVCFFDMQRRPSRSSMLQLNDGVEVLKERGVVVRSIQTAPLESDRLIEWTEQNGIQFPVGMIQTDEQQVRFNWGVRSLPWLILTDRNHTVVAEGFGVAELGQRIDDAPGE